MAEKKTYKLARGKFHGEKDGAPYVYKPGDSIELTDAQAASFKDLLEVEVAQSAAEPVKQEGDGKEGASGNNSGGNASTNTTKPPASGDNAGKQVAGQNK